MNITRLNFLESLPLVKTAISKSHFLSFDLQMSGIQTEQLTSPSIIDSMQKRYEKQKQSIDKFIPLQFGLSAFQVLPNLNKIIAYPFNFYIFPITQPFQTMKFSFHAGTMSFLTKNQFDFNKLFYEGIPYTSKQKLKFFEKQATISSFRSELRKLKQIESPQVKVFLKMNLPIAQQWVLSQSKCLDVNIAFIKYQSYMFLKEKIQAKYSNIPLIFQFDNEQIHRRTKMTIRKCNPQEKIANISKQSSSSQPDMLFNDVFDEIVKSGKPLILHNGFLDMMHVYYRFMQSLPQSWTDYKHKIHRLFPYLYDNKYLFASSPTLNHQTSLKLTGLQNCYVAMRQLAKKQKQSQSVKIQIAQDFNEYNLESLQCHEAGFDSLMTGYSFLKGVTHLNRDLNLLVNSRSFHTQHQLTRNRIPLGSIKIPFNFEQNNEDAYTKDGNHPIFFRSIINESVEQNKILDFFSRNYGSVNMLWTMRNQTEFCIIFINQQANNKFMNQLQTSSKNGNTLICQIQNVDFIVLTNEQHQKMMSNQITIEQQENKAVL